MKDEISCAHSEQDADLSGGCWSRARHSVFFTINATGLVEVYDILNGVNEPVAAYRVCDERLTAIAPHEAGDLLAVGAQNGEIYLVECAEGHTVSYKADKVNLNSVSVFCRGESGCSVKRHRKRVGYI